MRSHRSNRRSPFTTSATAVGLAALAVAGCNGATDPDDRPAPIEALPRDLTADEQLVVGASNRFGFDLLARLAADEPGQNHFTSPFSAHAALTMALNGARDSTLDAMRDVLGYTTAAGTPPTIEEIDAAYAGLADLLLDLDERVRFDVGNSVWYERTFPFRDEYVTTVRDAFDARVEALDFADPAAPDAINAWVDEATDGRIQEMVESIDPAEVLFLLNAIYFKGRWTDRFDPDDTYDADFRLEDGTTTTVRMMRREDGEHGLHVGADATIVDLPYGGGAFRYTVVLPPEGGSVAGLVADLDADTWQGWMAGLGTSDNPVHMPRFELEWEKGLGDALKTLGMEIAFVPGRANFGGMLAEGLDPQAPGTDLHITRVKQKTFVSVNEEGTEAAAATSVGVGTTSAPIPVVVDRPFLVAIRERLSGTIFFLGVVTDPTAE